MSRIRYYKVPTKKRYYVIDVVGFAITGDHFVQRGSNPPSVTYAILDRIYNHREVAAFESQGRGRGRVIAKERADALCAALNAEDAEDPGEPI